MFHSFISHYSKKRNLRWKLLIKFELIIKIAELTFPEILLLKVNACNTNEHHFLFLFSADKVISSKKTKTFLEEVEEKLNGMYIQVAVLVT